MVLEGAGVGEAVDQSFIRQVQRWDTKKLQRYARGGLSDQQTAYVRRQLALRSAGQQENLSQAEIIRTYAEPRKIVKPQIFVEEARLAKQIQSIPSNQRTSEQTRFLRNVLEKSGGQTAQTEALRRQEIEQFYNREKALENQRVKNELDKKIEKYKEDQESKKKFLDRVANKIEIFISDRNEDVLRSTINKLSQERNYLETVKRSNEGKANKKQLQQASIRQTKALLDSFSAKAAQTFGETALGLVYLARVPGLLVTKEGRVALATAIASLPSEVVKGVKDFGKLIKSDPEQGSAILLTEYVTLVGGGKAIRESGKVARKVANKVLKNNAFKKVEKLLIKKVVDVEKGIIRVNRLNEDFLRRKTVITVARDSAGRFKKVRKDLTLKVGGIPETKESLAKQLARGGKSATAVTAQANRLVKLLRQRRIIRKPLPFDEKQLSTITRRLLKRFDKGKLTPKEVLELNLRLRKESIKLASGQSKGVDLLERSVYFDPDRTLRKSRLQLQEDALEEANLFDLLSGRARLFSRKAKPQIIVLEDFVEGLPKTKEFASIVKKLKNSVKLGKDPNLTAQELARLSRWQVTPSGKLKPIGSTTYQGGLERELTLAPGEAIKRVQKLAILRIGSKRIPIVAVKIVKGKENVSFIRRVLKLQDEIKRLVKEKSRLKNPKLKSKVDKKIKVKTKELERVRAKKVSKEVKEFLRDSRRRTPVKKKVYPTKRKLTQATSRAVRRARVVRKKKRVRVTPRRSPTRRTTPRRGVTGRRPTPPKKPTRRTPPSRRTTSTTPTPRKTPPRKPPIRRPPPRKSPPPKKVKKPLPPRSKQRKGKKGRGKPEGYNVYIKSKGRLLKANTKPLSKERALDRRAYILDNSVSATGTLRPVKSVKKVGKISSKEYGARNKIKARNYRIVKGKRVPLKNTIIERRGTPRINTRGEKKQLSAARLIKQLNKSSTKRKKKRK